MRNFGLKFKGFTKFKIAILAMASSLLLKFLFFDALLYFIHVQVGWPCVCMHKW